MITIKDVAERAGVSYATVSRALNNRPDVNPETRKLVLKVAKEMGYQPNAIARSLVNKQTNIIALIVPDVSIPFFADLSKSVSQAAMEAGYTTMVCNTYWDRDKEREMLGLMQSQQVAGIIIKPTGFYEPGTFDAVNVPLVVFWHPTEDSTNYIEVDHVKGSRLAVENLVKRGFKRIAYLGGRGTSPANQLRLMTYQQVLQENDLPNYNELASFGEFHMDSGYERIREMMNQSVKPDAVFCGNDYIALGVLQYRREHGLSADEFGIIGYDDLYFSSLPMINLSSVSQPRDLLGEKAVELLMEDIDAEEEEERRKRSLLIEPVLKVRET